MMFHELKSTLIQYFLPENKYFLIVKCKLPNYVFIIFIWLIYIYIYEISMIYTYFNVYTIDYDADNKK